MFKAKEQPVKTPGALRKLEEMTREEFNDAVLYRGVNSLTEGGNSYWTTSLEDARAYASGARGGKNGRIRVMLKRDVPKDFIGPRGLADAMAEEGRLNNRKPYLSLPPGEATVFGEFPVNVDPYDAIRTRRQTATPLNQLAESKEFPGWMRDRAKLAKRLKKEAPGPTKPRVEMSAEERAVMDAIADTANNEMLLPRGALPDKLRAYMDDVVAAGELAGADRMIPPPKELHAGLKPGKDDIEYLGGLAGGAAHAGEGGWSPESIARAKTTKFFMLDKGTGKIRPLVGVDAVDIMPGPGEIKLQSKVGKAGYEVVGAGEAAPLGLGLQKTGPESMSPAQRAAYEKYMAARKGGGAIPATPPAAGVPAVAQKPGVAYAGKPGSPYAVIPEKAAADYRAPFIEPPPGKAPEVIKTLSDKPDAMPLYKHEAELLYTEPDLASHSFTKKGAEVKEWFENPLRIFEESKALKPIYNEGRRAADLTTRANAASDATLGTWKDSVKDVERASRSIGEYLIAKQKNGPESLKLSGVDPDLAVRQFESSPKLKALDTQIRAYYNDTFTRLNKARAVLGLDPIPYVENYHTFMRGVSELEAMGVSPISVNKPEFIRHMTEPTFKYKKREGIIGPLETDFFPVFKKYAHAANRYINEAYVVAKGRAMLSDTTFAPGTELGGKGGKTLRLAEVAPVKAAVLQEWIDRLAGKSSGNNVWARAARAVKIGIGESVLPFNARSAAIQPTSLLNTAVEIGPRWTEKGIRKYLSDPQARKFALAVSDHLKGRTFDSFLEDYMTGEIMRKVGRVKHAVVSAGTLPLRAGDASVASMSWIGAYEKAIASVEKGGLGLKGKAAQVFADDVVVRTQASGWVGDRAKIQNTALGGLVTTLQTFIINDWNFMAKDVMGWKNPNLKTLDRVKKITGLVLGTVLVNTVFEDGFNLQSPLPAPEREIAKTIRGEQDIRAGISGAARELLEKVPVIGGGLRFSTPKRQYFPSGVQQVTDATKLFTKILALDPEKISLYDLEAVAKMFGLPGLGQARKMIDRIKKGQPIPDIIMGGKVKEKPKSTWSEGW
jgi:hypothetical protein